MRRGDIKKRLKELAAALKAEPGSIPKRLELAAVLREAGRPAEAIDLYRGVAEAYAEDGRLVQAMAVCKGILDIDPEHRDTLEMLAALATRKTAQRPPLATISQIGGRWVAEPTGDRPLYAADDERTRAAADATPPSPGFADERTPAEEELRTPIGGDDERTPLGDPELTPLPAGDDDGEPLNWRARALHDEPTRDPGAHEEATRNPRAFDEPTRNPRAEDTRSGDDPDQTRNPRLEPAPDDDAFAAVAPATTAPGRDPEATRAGNVEAMARQRWSAAPRVATPMAPEDDPALDFPDETKRRARGHRLLDLTPGEPGLYADDGGVTAPTTMEEVEAAMRIDTDRMPTLSDEELAAAQAEATQRSSPRALDSGRLPPMPDELTFGDEDSAVRMLHDVIDGPFPRPRLSVEPPPFPLLSELPRGAFMELLARLSVVHLGAGQTVLREGEAGDACYLVAAGRVRVDKGGVAVAELGPGSFFGEFAVLSDQRRHASVVTLEPVQLLEIRRELLDELVSGYPGVARTLRTFYRERLLQTLLSTSPFFSSLNAEERATIAERFRPRRFGRGAQIIEEGAPGGGLYLILVGEVEVVRAGKADDANPRLVRLGTLGEGSYFGEMSLLRGGVASATVRALRMTEAVQLPPRDFYELASQHPVLWEQLRSEAERRELANHAILAGEARKSDTFYLV